MKPDYKNWIPKGMIRSFVGSFLAVCAGLIAAALVPLMGPSRIAAAGRHGAQIAAAGARCSVSTPPG